MSQCVDHKITFPETHHHFRLAIEISRKCPIVYGGLELKKSIVQKQILGVADYAILVYSLFLENQTIVNMYIYVYVYLCEYIYIYIYIITLFRKTRT